MADTKISELPVATAIASPDVAPIVQGGVTKQADVSLFGGSFTNIFRVDPDPSTGAQFQTVQSAINAIQALLPIPDWPVIDIGNNQFLEDVTTSLGTLAFIGRRLTFDHISQSPNSPFNNLTFSASALPQKLALINCNARLSTIIGNTVDLSGIVPGLEVDLVDSSAGVVRNEAATPRMSIFGYGSSFVDSVQDTIGGGVISLHEVVFAPDGQIYGQSDTTWKLYNCIGVKFLPVECASFTVENTPLLVASPPSIPITVTFPSFLPIANSAGNAIVLGLASKNGIPDVGFTGFEKGSLCMDTANGKLYVNGGDATTPDWRLVVSL